MRHFPAVPFILAASPVLADAEGASGHHHMHEFGWGGMIFGPLMMLVFVALIAGAVILVLRTLGAGPGRGGNARTILEERFARGEIDMDEFNARKAALDV